MSFKEVVNIMETRIEYDSMGPVEVDARRIYGPQTQRSFNNFKIGDHRIPIEQIKALALVKKACALTNAKCGAVTEEKAKLIAQVVDEIVDGKWDDEFPLTVFQTGSGTQTNMNVNEVIAHRAKQLDESNPLHPNDDVNRGQSTNDTFPTAMHICGYFEITKRVIPALDGLIVSFEKLQEKGKGLQKVGRTHLQDATFIMVDQEISAFVDGLKTAKTMLLQNADYLLDVALGGTAVGTGINTPKGYLDVMETVLPEVTGAPFRVKNNKFQGLALKDAFMMAHGALNTLATTLFKIANDVRFLGSGPRCGYGEWHLPENEPGSSIMPGKVNPVIPEVMNQVAYKVIGNDLCVTMSGEAAQMELNAMEPVMAQCCFESADLLMNGFDTLRTLCVDGITANEEKCRRDVHNSIGVVTALNPVIGYKNSTKIAKEALETGKGVYELVLEHNILSKKDLDTILKPENMIKPVKLDIHPNR